MADIPTITLDNGVRMPQLGNVVILKSVTPSRIRENIQVFDFTLDDADLSALSGLDRGERTGPDPDEFNEA
ncbi:MAG TPA: hypothetical protein VGP70_08665 [Actinomadura sp.]|jgi:diketogulonate reductase-like aldo/keto reductase|nr:hypothetical protein [Actinomadura sp.]